MYRNDKVMRRYLKSFKLKTHTYILKKNKIDVSKTKENLCYENALAKRLTRFLKMNFIYTKPLQIQLTRKELQKMQLIYTTK